MEKQLARVEEANRRLLAENERLATAAEAELRQLFDFMPQLGWTARPDGSIDFYNRGWYDYTGTTFETMQGWGWQVVHDPQILPSVLARWQESLAAGTPFEMEFPLRRRDGHFRWFLTRVSPVRDVNGVISRWVGINTDVDDQRRARQSVEEDFDHFFQMSIDLLCIAGLDGVFRRVNAAWMKVLGWTEAELTSKPWLDFVHPEDREATVGAGSQLNECSLLLSFTNRYACKDGTYRWLEWQATQSTARGLIYAVARDITARREQEAAHENIKKRLIIADRMVSIGTLAAGVAHEINNPLGYITANLDMVREEIRALAGASPSGRMNELEDMVNDAREGAERVRKIVRGLKTFSRTDDERHSVVDLKPILELAINMSFNEIRHRARLVKDYGETPLVEGDDARLGQVFLNLLVNAAQAIPEGNMEANEIRLITSTDAEGHAVIEVRDTGPGISESVRDRIFDPFFTTKSVGVGTGLGLSICHNILTGMNATISVRSSGGHGTTFRVVIPPSRVQELPSVDLPPRANPAQRRGAILVVDDERAVGIVLGRVLREHDVTVVTSVSDALKLFASGKKFDVIFSDMMMPQMSGMDFYRELAARSPQDAGRIVFVTGGAFTTAAKEFLDRVPNERMGKPFVPQAIRELVQKLL